MALDGRYSDHSRRLLSDLLAELECLETRRAELHRRISEYMETHADLVRRLRTIPGVDRITAWTLIAGLGTDMSQFADDAPVASWAGLCPGNTESAGKRFSGRTRKGERYLRRIPDILRDGGQYGESGGDYFDRRNPERTARRQPPLLPATPGSCNKCEQWGIPCIHVRNQELHSGGSPTAPDPNT